MFQCLCSALISWAQGQDLLGAAAPGVGITVFHQEIEDTCFVRFGLFNVCVKANGPGNGRRLETLCVPPGSSLSRSVSLLWGQWGWRARDVLHKLFGFLQTTLAVYLA